MDNIQDLFKEFEETEDLFAEFDRQKQEANKKTVSDAIYPETFEGKYLQPLYDIAAPVAKSLSVLEKPLSTSMAVGKTIGRGINELSGTTEDGAASILEPLKQEALAGIYPAPENSISSGLRDLEIGTEPIIGDVLPEGIKAQFPKASAVISSVAPVDVADMAVSGAYGSKLPSMAGGQLDDMKVADKQIAKNALIRGSQKDVKFVGELEKHGKINTLADKVISDPAIRSRLTNPKKMVEYLDGYSTENTDKITGARNKVTIVPGKLQQVGSELGGKVKSLSRSLQDKKMFFDTNNFTDDVVSEIMQDADKIGSGVSYDPAKLKAEVQKFTKAKGRGTTLESIDAGRVPFEDLVAIKRGAADRIFSMKQVNFADVENPTFAEAVAQKVWSKADNEINKIAEAMDDFELIKLNNEFSDYQKIRELYANKNIAERYIPSLLEDIVPAAAIGGTVGLATGNPYLGAVAAGGYPMARSGAGTLSNNFPSMALNTRMGVLEPALKVGSMLKPSVAATGLAASQLPRNTDEIIAMKDQFLAKIAMETKTPQGKQLFDEVVNIMENNPQQIKSVLPMLMKAYPNAFQNDPYNRIDGEILDPILKQKAIEQIIHNQPSSVEGAKQMQLLLNGNKYYGN
jgi:hypothetical protein